MARRLFLLRGVLCVLCGFRVLCGVCGFRVRVCVRVCVRVARVMFVRRCSCETTIDCSKQTHNQPPRLLFVASNAPQAPKSNPTQSAKSRLKEAKDLLSEGLIEQDECVFVCVVYTGVRPHVRVRVRGRVRLRVDVRLHVHFLPSQPA